MEHELYTVDEAAALLKLHPKTLRRKIREGDLQSTRLGKQYRISQQQLESYCGQKLSVGQKPEIRLSRHVLASSVVDVDAISPEENSRISNSLMASLNTGLTGTRVDCIYYEEVGKLKIVVHGNLESTGEILKLINTLLSQPELR